MSEPSVTAFILAGGLGKRIRGLTSLPKCMIVINGKPLLYHWIDTLSKICEKIYISLYYKGNHMRSLIQERYPDLFGLNIICDGKRGQWAHANKIAEQIQTEKLAIILADNYWEGFEKGKIGIDRLRELLIIPEGKAASIGMMPQIFSTGEAGDSVWNGMLTIWTPTFQLLAPQFHAHTIIGKTIVSFIQGHYHYHSFLMPGCYIDIGNEATIELLKKEGHKVGL